MNIAFVVPNAGLGGHTRTGVTIAKALRERGHQLVFVVGRGADSSVITDAGFDLATVGRDWRGRWQFESELAELCKTWGLEFVHTFEDKGLAELAMACESIGLPVFYTICGGRTPVKVLPIRPTISLSEEVRDGIIKRSSMTADDIPVIPARIDLGVTAQRELKPNDDLIRCFRAKYDIPTDAKVILRIARLAPEYETSIVCGVDMAARLVQQGVCVRFVHIGYPEIAWTSRKIQNYMAKINEACGVKVAVSAQDEAASAASYLSMGDVVFGAGRSAFEAMLAGKPTLIVGRNGYAGTVCEESVNELAYYNFSGRNVQDHRSVDDDTSRLSMVIARLLQDEEYRDKVSAFGEQYVRLQLDVSLAASEYERIYETFPRKRYPSRAEIEAFLPSTFEYWKDRLLSESLKIAILESLASAKRILRLAAGNGTRPGML